MNVKANRARYMLLALVVLAAGLGGWAVMRGINGSAAPEYATASVTRGDIEVTISAAGTLTPKEMVDVGAQVSGQLQTLFVDVGDTVEAGDLLAQIDATIAESSVEAKQAQLEETRASFRQQQASLKLLEAEAERATMLYEADAIARADYEAAVAELEIGKGRLDAIRAQISSQESSLRAEEANLEFTKIYAPITGTVVSLSAVEGQTLNANQTAPTIMTIADLSVMTVEADVSEADVLRVTEGQAARFSTLGDSDRVWPTEVRQILPTPEVVNDVVLYKALLDVENPDGILRSEMTAQVFFIEGRSEDALLVPVAALRDRPARPERTETDTQLVSMPDPTAPAGRSARRLAGTGDRFEAYRAAREANPDAEEGMVLVMGEDGTPVPRRVLIGLKTRAQAEVLHGLEEGELVIIGEVARPSARASGRRQDGPPAGFMRPPR